MNQKPVIGEKLIAETPKGRHYSERLIENVTVTKVGRKYFSVIFEGSSRHEEFLLESWRRSGDNTHVNFPINLFRSHEEMEDRNEKAELVSLLADYLRYRSDWSKMNLSVLREVAKITAPKQ